jgi:fatty-acid desaturase
MAVVLWLRVRSGSKLDKKDAELHNQRTAELFMQAGNWASTAVNVVIGVLLGIAIHGVAGLLLRGAWFYVVILVVLSAALFLIVRLHGFIGEKLFPSGIRPARNPQAKRKRPLTRRLSFPAGLVLGIVLAAFGLDDPLIGWL